MKVHLYNTCSIRLSDVVLKTMVSVFKHLEEQFKLVVVLTLQESLELGLEKSRGLEKSLVNITKAH